VSCELVDIAKYVLQREPGLLVLNKPEGVSLFADRGEGASLWDALKQYCQQENLSIPLQVHRLDKGTSGVLLVALDRAVQSSLTRQFTEHRIQKTYLARVVGTPSPSNGFIDLPLRPGRKSRYRVAGLREQISCDRDSSGRWAWRLQGPPMKGGKDSYPSYTQYRILGTNEHGHSLVMLRPTTGRTHQLRVHLSWCGWPIMGDHLYGKPKNEAQQADRLMLHCWKISVYRDWDSAERPKWVTWKASPVF
jgi:tRNA pseudouridine32 synthase / 23S rRNA pseudouridine746 synthase